MAAGQHRAAIYLRVSTMDRRTAETQGIAVSTVAERRWWVIVQTSESQL